ncbi:MAG TPA: DUF423 domain-containing protein [Gammaproteobacteria bacterium]|nr:DUF423 domain-containing protein [Gammaproteobacteria bacterium]
MSARLCLVLAAGYGLTAVALGALGAHAIKDLLGPDGLSTWQTASQYQMWHALALFSVGIWMAHGGPKRLGLVAWMFSLGILLFSGSLYGLTLGSLSWLGPLTPIGGLLLILGWVTIGLSVIKADRVNAP